MENNIYSWHVKNGTVLIQRNGDCISLQLDYEKHDSCLLAASDTDEIIEILTGIAQQIWSGPNYQKKPYTSHLYKKNDDGSSYYWEIETSTLRLKQIKIENTIAISCEGNKTLNLEINYAIEIIQVLELFNYD